MQTMKIAISVPDTLFDAGERLASERGLSRSELYARALRAYLDVHGEAALTAGFDAVYAQPQVSRIDPALARAQQQVLDDEAW